MLLYTPEKRDFDKSWQEVGETGFTDVTAAQFNTFVYEDRFDSRERNWESERLRIASLAYDADPKLFGDVTPDLIEGSGHAIDTINYARKETAALQNKVRASDYEGFVEPNIEYLKSLNPEILDREEIDQRIADNAEELRAKFEDVHSRADGWDAFWGTLAGAAGGAMTDPINQTAMLVGAPIAGVAAVGRAFGGSLMRVMFVEFGIAATSEAIIQAGGVYDYKKEINSPWELRDSLFAIGAAGLGAAVLSGSVHSILRGWKKLRGKPDYPFAKSHITERFMRDLAFIQKQVDELKHGASSEADIHARVQVLADIMADIKAGRTPDLSDLDSKIDLEQMQWAEAEIDSARIKMDKLVQRRNELDQQFDQELYEHQLNLKGWTEQKMTPFEERQAREAAGQPISKELDDAAALEDIRFDQQKVWEAQQAEESLRANEQVNQAIHELRASRRDNGDMLKIKEEMDVIDARFDKEAGHLKIVNNAKEEYIKIKTKEAEEKIKIADHDSESVRIVKNAVNMYLRQIGAPEIKVKVYEDGFTPMEGMRFSRHSPDELIDDIPVIEDFAFLEGKTVKPTIADLTEAGVAYRGIDSSEVDPIWMQGGVDYPHLASSKLGEVVWAVDKSAVKLKGSDYVAVMAMTPRSHKTNKTTTRAVFSTLEAYVRDKRISDENMLEIDALIKKKLPDFAGIEDIDKFHDYVEGLTFEKRGILVDVLDSAKAQELGAPSVQKILRKTVSKKYAGLNLHDAAILIKVDPDHPIVELGTSGTRKHDSYKYGVKGKIVGRLPAGVSREIMFPDWAAARRAEGQPESGDNYSFQRALPVQKMTKDIYSKFRSTPFESIDSPRQLKLAVDMIRGNWKDSSKIVKAGGVAPKDFVAAIKSSEASASLEQYSLKDLNKYIKNGTMSVYQLGDSEVFFALKRAHSYKDSYGFEHPDLTDNEVMLTGVVSNEVSARGVGAPAILLKAIEEGVTVLDAFAVRSSRFPNGYLPATYEKFGFETLGYEKFEAKYVDGTEGGSPAQFADLKKFWKDNGWNEADGYPDIAIMKWRGTDDARTNATQRFDQEDIIGIDTSRVDADVAEAEAAFQARLGEPDGQPAGVDRGVDSGSVRVGDRGGSTSRAHSAVREAISLTDDELSNLGLERSLVDEVAEMLGLDTRYSKTDAGVEAAIDPVTGELHINASAIRDHAHLVEILREEVIGHYGLRKSLGAEFDTVIKSIQSAAKTNTELRDAWVALSGVDPKTGQILNPNAAYHGMGDDVIADEIISKMARDELSDTTWQKLKTILIKALRKVGLVTDDITITEMKSLVIKSEQALAKRASMAPTPMRTSVSGIKPKGDAIDEPIDEADFDKEVAEVLAGKEDDIPIHDADGNPTNYRASLEQSEAEIQAYEAIKVCML